MFRRGPADLTPIRLRDPDRYDTSVLVADARTRDAHPTVQSFPGCVGSEAGVMTTAVALFDTFDAGGRDTGAWEVQDGCDATRR